jgi:diketogulonate reductase-like aldo/keto reductase
MPSMLNKPAVSMYIYMHLSTYDSCAIKVKFFPLLLRHNVYCDVQLDNKCHAAHEVKAAIQQVLSELQLDHIDLFLMHWPVTGNKGPTVEPPIKVSPKTHLTL